MSVQKIRWSRVYESSEEELTVLLSQRKIKAVRVAGEAGSIELDQSSDRNTTLWCAEGSFYVRTATTSTSLQPGDAITIEADTKYEIHAGISGYVYYVSK